MSTPAVAPKREIKKRDVTDISSMLLPLADSYLLLPGVAVAEITTFIPPEPDFDEEAPMWLLGHIYWRKQKLSLVSYEMMMGRTSPPVSDHCRIAVLNNTGLNHQLGFFAVLLQGTPRLLRLSPSDIVQDNEKVIDEGEKLHVQVEGEEAVVPDISFIEKNIINYFELS